MDNRSQQHQTSTQNEFIPTSDYDCGRSSEEFESNQPYPDMHDNPDNQPSAAPQPPSEEEDLIGLAALLQMPGPVTSTAVYDQATYPHSANIFPLPNTTYPTTIGQSTPTQQFQANCCWRS